VSTYQGRPLAPGVARGDALTLVEPLSLWGGFDAPTGRIIDGHHPQHGADVAGRILVMPSGRGSSSSSSVLAEAVRLGTAPAGIVIGGPDLILAIGAAVAAELYGIQIPVVELAPPELARIADGAPLTIQADGTIRIAESR
jgi:uncharacterized protein